MMTRQEKTPEVSAAEEASTEAMAEAMADRSEAFTPLTMLIQEVVAFMGTGFIKNVPLELLEDYCLHTITRNEPTGQLLYNLIVNFMAAYRKTATSEDAMKAYDYLEHLAHSVPPSKS